MNGIDNQINNIEKFCQKKMSELKYNKIHKPIYHYTTLENFIKIIKSGTFYFTYYKHLNDINELLHGIEIMKEVVRENQFPDSDF